MMDILSATWSEYLRVLPILLAAIVASQIVEHFLHKRKTHHQIASSEKNIVRAAALGVVTPGPLLAYLPTLRDFVRQGTPPSLIVAYITGQTLIGPMRIFLEVSYFGWPFFLLRAILSFLLAIGIASGYYILNMRFRLIKKQV